MLGRPASDSDSIYTGTTGYSGAHSRFAPSYKGWWPQGWSSRWGDTPGGHSPRASIAGM